MSANNPNPQGFNFQAPAPMFASTVTNNTNRNMMNNNFMNGQLNNGYANKQP